MNTLIQQIREWGIEKGITGPNGTGTLLGQLSKTQEELTETRDAAVGYLVAIEENCDIAIHNWRMELKDGIGDTVVTLILAADLAALEFEECLQAAYDEIKGRTGKMVNGQFVKNND